MSRAIRSIASLLSVVASPLLAQRPVPAADYAKWETLGTGTLSPDGKWVAYDFRRGSHAGDLRYRTVASDAEHTVPFGVGPVFTRNSRWLLYTITPDSGDGERGGSAGKGAGRGAGGAGAAPGANHNKVGIVDLRSGRTSVLEDIDLFVPSNDGLHVALRRYVPAGPRSGGADLVVRDLAQGTDVTFGNVAGFAWSDDGALLGMTIDVAGKTGNGVQVLDAATGAIRSLDAGDMLYSNLHWREHANDLVAFRSRVDSAFADTSYNVIAWRGVSTPRVTKQVYDFGTDNTFPKGMRVASYRSPQWSDDGSTLFFGIAPREPKSAPPDRRASAPQPARVEVWHWKDLREYHQQDRQAQQDRQKTQLVAWHIGHLGPNTLVRLADDTLDNVQLSDNEQAAIATDERPYVKDVMSGAPIATSTASTSPRASARR